MFLWPTTRGWVICLSAVAWIMVAMVNHALFALILGWACTALAIVSLLCACFSLHGIQVSRAAGGDAVCGQLLNLPLRIVNTKWRRRQPIVVQEVLRDARTLCFPVCPDAHDAVVDVVSSHEDVDRRMELDARDLSAA